MMTGGAYPSYNILRSNLRFDGSHMWTRVWGGPGGDWASRVAIGPDDRVHVSGIFEMTADLDPTEGVDTHTSNGGRDVFITTLNPDGSYAWSHTFGGPLDEG